MTRHRRLVPGLPPLVALALALLFVLGCPPGGGGGGGTPPPPPGPPTPPAPTAFVRMDINSYAPDSAFITSFRTGVQTMMSRPVTDPTSWGYQANIHGIAGAGSNCAANSSGPALPSWATCQHGSWFFLAWHRMYLYYFERILRAASGDPAFALPFWDYEDSAQWPLPVVFRSPADATNPLYVAERNTDPGIDMNAGDPLPGSDTNAGPALSRIPFSTPTQSLAATTFAGWQAPAPVHFAGGYGQLERLPHNAIHNDVGGDTGWMSDPDCAARDPIFWLHHANIDRLWQVWLNQNAGRANPTPPSGFLTQSFTFFDFDGTAKTLTGADILDTVAQLDYSYEGVPAAAPAAAPPATAEAAPTMTTLATSEEGVKLGDEAEEVTVKVDATAMAEALGDATPEPMVLTLEGLHQDRRGVNYEVYLNLPSGTAPDPKGPYYAGHVSVFVVHHGAEDTLDYSLDVTETVKGLQAKGEWTGDLKVTFVRSVPAGPTAEAAAVHLRFKRIKLEG